MYEIVYLVLLSLQILYIVSKIDLTTFGRKMIIKQIFTEPETEVKWYFDDSIERIVIVGPNRLSKTSQAKPNRLRGTFTCACASLYAYVYVYVYV